VNINWVLADNLSLAPGIDLDRLKNAGSFWGSWRTWRAYTTDNVICHDRDKAKDLIKRNFQTECNLYVPNSSYALFGRPQGVRVYEGDFMGHDVDNQDELVAMYLAATTCDIVLLLGFDWLAQEPKEDKIEELRARNYRGLVERAIKSQSDVQWVVIDHPGELRPELANLDNVSTDTLDNVLAFLNS
jgi:cellulose biosynthesis protein BcsQ